MRGDESSASEEWVSFPLSPSPISNGVFPIAQFLFSKGHALLLRDRG
jgi:hypothetical protein